ncbi:hypothetical protein [Oceanicaulis alexandrii]|uniref:hypothetical protein n=1 Tax=Oceanicaulis alexandrii TaxID=153233 RepID=UPI003B5058D8|tara:strand:- start:178 stop:555 length:378 start_codon:yes stop_codon:yes gene_type:complete
MEPNIIRMTPYEEPSVNNFEQRNLASFDFETGGIHVYGNTLRQNSSGELLFVTVKTKKSGGRRPVKIKDALLANKITNAAVRAYFVAGGQHIDPDHVAEHGYSLRIGVDGFPLDPRHPFNRKSAA